jgi:hypothetical protein
VEDGFVVLYWQSVPEGGTRSGCSPAEFYAATKRVTGFVLAMLKFDDQLQLVRYRTTLERLADDAIRAGAEVRPEPPDKARKAPNPGPAENGAAPRAVNDEVVTGWGGAPSCLPVFPALVSDDL